MSRKISRSQSKRLEGPGSTRWLSTVRTSTPKTQPAASAHSEGLIHAQVTMNTVVDTCEASSIFVSVRTASWRVASQLLVDSKPEARPYSDTTAMTLGSRGSAYT